MKRKEFLKALAASVAATVVVGPIAKALSTPNTPCNMSVREILITRPAKYYDIELYNAINISMSNMNNAKVVEIVLDGQRHWRNQETNIKL